MEQDITCKKEKELFFSYLGSLRLGALLLLLIAFLYFYNNFFFTCSHHRPKQIFSFLNFFLKF